MDYENQGFAVKTELKQNEQEDYYLDVVIEDTYIHEEVARFQEKSLVSLKYKIETTIREALRNLTYQGYTYEDTFNDGVYIIIKEKDKNKGMREKKIYDCFFAKTGKEIVENFYDKAQNLPILSEKELCDNSENQV